MRYLGSSKAGGKREGSGISKQMEKLWGGGPLGKLSSDSGHGMGEVMVLGEKSHVPKVG